jgi:hypothetical protein
MVQDAHPGHGQETEMALADLSDPVAVDAAMDEFDELGESGFLSRYGFGRARRYVVIRDGRQYPSKAIAAAAHGHQFGWPLDGTRLRGGVASAVPKLRDLGFEVLDLSSALVEGQSYGWGELGDLFDFKPGWLNRMGGMGSRPEYHAILLVTRSDGASFEYEDYWDGNDLIYSGHGQVGDQRRVGTNRMVAENERDLHVFEPAGSQLLLYRGSPRCVRDWTESGIDRGGDERQIIRFRLRFDPPHPGDGDPISREAEQRRAVGRPFDRDRRPRVPRASERRADPEQTRILQEKASAGHHEILCALHACLEADGWTQILESKSSYDLRAVSPQYVAVIFEAKTVRGKSERDRVRAGAIQLLEYRYIRGDADDRLCLVTDRPISERRRRFLATLGISAVSVDQGNQAVCVDGSPLTEVIGQFPL